MAKVYLRRNCYYKRVGRYNEDLHQLRKDRIAREAPSCN
jgi:hypothetical protein